MLRLVGHVVELSREKFASNVIEEAFKHSSVVQVKMLAEELLHETSDRFPPLAQLVNDKFGNYVIQTLLETSTGTLRERLLESLRKCRKCSQDYGKHLFMKVNKMLGR